MRYLDIFFTAIFTIEMFLKWLGLGFKKYFTNPWCLLDFFIVVIAVLSITLEAYENQIEDQRKQQFDFATLQAAESTSTIIIPQVVNATSQASLDMASPGKSQKLKMLRVLRAFRALRPLRAMSKVSGIKIVTDALVCSIPSILNVLVILLLFWLVFAIVGINMFRMKFFRCVWVHDEFIQYGQKQLYHTDDIWDSETGNLTVNIGLPLAQNYQLDPKFTVRNKQDCLDLNLQLMAEQNRTSNITDWQNLWFNFDTILDAYISLIQVATFKGWLTIMKAAIDSTARDQQPRFEYNFVCYIYFVIFILFGAFFTLNLFISVVIDNFNEQKRNFDKNAGELFLTDLQRQLYRALRRLKKSAPKKLLICPETPIRKLLFKMVMHRNYELATLFLTISNLILLAFEGNVSESLGFIHASTFDQINYFFLGVFTIEVGLRIIALGKCYTYQWVNTLDAILVGLSLSLEIIVALKRTADRAQLEPELMTSDDPHMNIFGLWLPMLKLLRAIRILRVARVATGIRTLIFSFMLSLPALTNVVELLLLIMFIYSIFGMNLFAFLKHSAGINDILNFENFLSSFLLLFEISTSAGWDQFLEPMLYEDEPWCDKGKYINNTTYDNCGSPIIGRIYIISYLVVTFIIVTNIGAVRLSYSSAHFS